MENKEQVNIRNAHCTYFEGQTGLCKAKEFVKCNPVNCKLYTIDELSTILDLQEQLKRKEQECEKLRFNLKHIGLIDLMNRNVKLQNAFNEISQILETYYHNGISEILQSQMELTTYLLNVCKAKLNKISNIINKVKEK